MRNFMQALEDKFKDDSGFMKTLENEFKDDSGFMKALENEFKDDSGFMKALEKKLFFLLIPLPGLVLAVFSFIFIGVMLLWVLNEDISQAKLVAIGVVCFTVIFINVVFDLTVFKRKP